MGTMECRKKRSLCSHLGVDKGEIRAPLPLTNTPVSQTYSVGGDCSRHPPASFLNFPNIAQKQQQLQYDVRITSFFQEGSRIGNLMTRPRNSIIVFLYADGAVDTYPSCTHLPHNACVLVIMRRVCSFDAACRVVVLSGELDIVAGLTSVALPPSAVSITRLDDGPRKTFLLELLPMCPEMLVLMLHGDKHSP
jgi:hypothetical protein